MARPEVQDRGDHPGPGLGAGDWGDGDMLGARDFCAREQARLGDEFQRLAGATRGPGTIRGLRTPGLKFLWFGATREFEYPPTQ